ncbi:Protein indeterminate-domain 1 [Hibiscus syriacus]|uniref:Protein indeterminate-domain 1 n=1 Tax=Hibiscus syriacus TaxID=106335 RepID=A0A6A2YMU8_HIBSY|nr:zinc finger protein GAI-ASSOCIATED FACTOR 1-like [Hibiscus syriacus]KAE8680639.1 Protein indeterminate-domain 1 [Hibiscus syriacus]
MPAELDNSSTASGGEASISSSGNQNPPPKTTVKKKRNLPGMPDPDADVIALSPKTLLATNRFVCEICNKGFQRNQNLQLHRRGHNLPWKLRQRSSNEVKKKVYVCPEPTCIHHDPSRALGDLTGIKKHYCRKHGEKKWKCDKCSKKYAVQSDWKAHSKICGTREYKCDCGTVFSRRDSFITHRAFCDALAEESAKAQPLPEPPNPKSDSDPKPSTTGYSPPQAPEPEPAVAPVPVAAATPALSQSTSAIPSSVLPIQSSESPENPIPDVERALALAPAPARAPDSGNVNYSSSTGSVSNGSSGSNVFASLFAPSTTSASLQPPQPPAFTDLIRSMCRPDCPADLVLSTSAEPISLCLSTNHGSSIFGTAGQERRQYAPPPQPAMSATALLQKAAQMGAAASSTSLLRGLGIISSSAQHDNLQWGQRQVEPESSSIAAGLGLGLPCDERSGLKELMMGTPVFGPKQTTLDFLGLGVAAGGTPNSCLSALITSIGSGLDVTAASTSFGVVDFTSNDIGRSS